MLGSWILGIVFVLLCVVAVFMRIKYVNFARIEKLHQSLGSKLGVQLAYLNSRSFTIFGSYRGYTIHLEPTPLPNGGAKETYGVKCFIPMVNPNRKALRIRRKASPLNGLEQIALIDHPIHLTDGMGRDIEMLTNDLLFSGLILSDDVKISLYEVLQLDPDGLLYLFDDELAFFSPHLIQSPEQIESWRKIANLLCDMKDELQF